MRLLGNIIWLIFGGLLSSILWYFFGLLLCISVIGLPLGLQFFKFGRLMLAPFGNEVNINFEQHPILNIVWLIFFGWEMAIGYLVTGLLLCITIIGIPFGKQWFKLTKLALFPFGSEIV